MSVCVCGTIDRLQVGDLLEKGPSARARRETKRKKREAEIAAAVSAAVEAAADAGAGSGEGGASAVAAAAEEAEEAAQGRVVLNGWLRVQSDEPGPYRLAVLAERPEGAALPPPTPEGLLLLSLAVARVEERPPELVEDRRSEEQAGARGTT